MPIEAHQEFNEPIEETVIWKYLSLEKYIWTLQEGALWFSDVSQFNDPLEATFVLPEVNSGRGILGTLPMRLGRSTTPEEQARFALINSWHIAEYESASMWTSYALNSFGVALKANYRNLKSGIIDTGVSAGEVVYSADSIVPSNANAFARFLVKHPGYSSEQELRLATPNLMDETGNFPNGRPIKIDFDQLVSEIRVCPTATDWEIETIKKLTRTLGSSAPVLRSELNPS